MHTRHIVILGLPRSMLFFHIFSWKAQFSKKKKAPSEHKMCVLIFSTTFVRNIYDSKEK